MPREEQAPQGREPEAAGSTAPASPRPAHRALPHPDRARQFMPFAALKGYYDLVRAEERTVQPRRALADEEAAALSAAIARLRKGDLARVTYYDDGAYVTVCGAVTQIDPAFRILRIVKASIAFDDILSLEPLEAPGTSGVSGSSGFSESAGAFEALGAGTSKPRKPPEA